LIARIARIIKKNTRKMKMLLSAPNESNTVLISLRMEGMMVSERNGLNRRKVLSAMTPLAVLTSEMMEVITTVKSSQFH